MYSICPARELCSRAPGNVVGAFEIRSHESPVTNHQSRFTAFMANDDSAANQAETPQPGFLARTLFSTDHKVIGLNYLWLALFSVFLGLAMSLLMRIHLVWPAVRLPFLSGSSLERYAALTTFHGSLMVFPVLTAAPQAGFGNYFLPLQIGAREMAFPILNRLSFWATAASLLGLTIAFLVAPETGITFWIASVAIFSLASLCNGINFSVTTIDLRARGMTLPRLPLTVWAWFINAILSTLIFSILLAASVCLLSDRLLSTHFFPSLNFLAGQPANFVANFLPVLWQRLFWFFAQAEVYIAMLPCFGLVTHLLSTFSRKPVWMERLVVLALCGVGVFGFCVWGQHMFASGMNPFSPLVFSLLASSLGLPAAILLISWLGTLWNARLQLNTSMLFAIGFVSLFLAGGISGIFLAGRDLAAASTSRSARFIFGSPSLASISSSCPCTGSVSLPTPTSTPAAASPQSQRWSRPSARSSPSPRSSWSSRREFFSSIFCGVSSTVRKWKSAIPGARPLSNGASPLRRPPGILAPPARWCIVELTNSACPASPKISFPSTCRPKR